MLFRSAILDGFAHTSFTVPLVHGDFAEAAHRLYEYPVSNALDVTGATLSGSKLSHAAGVKISKYMPREWEKSLMEDAGYRRDLETERLYNNPTDLVSIDQAIVEADRAPEEVAVKPTVKNLEAEKLNAAVENINVPLHERQGFIAEEIGRAHV